MFNHHTALWGRPVGIAASPLEPGARRGEPTNRARLVHHINSDGPRGPRSRGVVAWLLRQTPARASQCCFMPRMRVRMSSCERLHSKYVLR